MLIKQNMFSDSLAPAWQDLHQRLFETSRIAIGHGERFVEEFLRDSLAELGVLVEHRHSVATPIEAETHYDLVITGLELTKRDVPNLSGFVERLGGRSDWLIVSSSAELKDITAAFEAGASDVITRPFENTGFLLKRIVNALNDKTNRKLLDLVVQYLKRALVPNLSTGLRDQIDLELRDYKAGLRENAVALVYDDSADKARSTALLLNSHGCPAAATADPMRLLDRVRRNVGAAVVLMSLEMQSAPWLIRRLNIADRNIEVLVTTPGHRRSRLLPHAGVSDVVALRQEGPHALASRTRRLLSRTRHRQLYLHLVSTLFAAAEEVRPGLAAELVFASEHTRPRGRTVVADDDSLSRHLPRASSNG